MFLHPVTISSNYVRNSMYVDLHILYRGAILILWMSCFWWILWTLDISWYNITRCCTQCDKFEGKTSVKFRTHERQPYVIMPLNSGFNFSETRYFWFCNCLHSTMLHPKWILVKRFFVLIETLMSQRVGFRDIYKIVTWSDHYCLGRNNMNL